MDLTQMDDTALRAALADLARRIEQRARALDSVTAASFDPTLAAWRKQRATLEAEQCRRQRGRVVAELRRQQVVLRNQLAAASATATALACASAQLASLDRLLRGQPDDGSEQALPAGAAALGAQQVRAALEELLAAQR